jgi:fatty-acyl-CoA synthase
MECVYELLLHLRSHEDHTAVIYKDEVFTYGDLIKKSCKLAKGLKPYISPSDRIAVWVPNSIDWIVIELAAGLIGATIVNLNMRYKSHELNYILEHSKSKMIIFQPRIDSYDYKEILEDVIGVNEIDKSKFPSLEYVVSTMPVLNNSESHYRLLDHFFTHEEVVLEDFKGESSPDSLMNILYTSGTTSNPKGVMHNQRMALVHGLNAGHHMKMTSSDILIGGLPFCGIFGYIALFSVLTHAASLVAMERYKPFEMIEIVDKFKATIFFGLDNMCIPFFDLDLSKYILTSLRVGVVSIFMMDNLEFINTMENIFPNATIVQTYGMSEIGSFVCVGRVDAPLEERVLAGGPPIHPEIQAEIINPDTEEILPLGQEGEIVIRGYNVMIGYLDAPEITKESFTKDGNFFKTGDLAVKLNNGSVIYYSRIKDSLRLKGFLVSPKEIEDYILLLPELNIVQIVGVKLEGEEIPVAFTNLIDGAPLDAEAIISHCKLGLADFKVPKEVFFIDTFPTTPGPNGDKIQKAKLRDMALKLITKKREAIR